jgi:hypothetical protein
VPITYEISAPDSLIAEVWLGDISIAAVRGHWLRLLQDEKAMVLRKSLADLRGSTLLFTAQELSLAIRDLAQPMLKGRDWISAIVVSTPGQIQLSSAYQGLALAYSHDVIFSNVDEARHWLLNQEPRVA